MKSHRYVLLDPTGNLTCLVLDPAEPAEEPAITGELLGCCEQVAYLEPASGPESAAAIRLMGGEFCGNAAMAAAAWLVRERLAEGQTLPLFLEVSGTARPVRCAVRRDGEGYEGTVEMPGSPVIAQKNLRGTDFTVVRLEGIVHLICERPLEKENAETLLKDIAGQLPDEAVGLIQWDSAARRMKPLVYVRGSGSLVWEHGCGSGSAAVGAYEALKQGDGEHRVSVRQPGGTIIASVRVSGGKVAAVSITGRVRFCLPVRTLAPRGAQAGREQGKT